MTLQQASELARGVLFGPDAYILRIVTDSRKVAPGDLFVALKGDRFDAHRFVTEVRGKGVPALVHVPQQHQTTPISGSVAGWRASARPIGSLICADNTRLALGRLASGWALRLPALRIGITGSNGKTTVKEMLAAILRRYAGSHAVLATAGNFNNDIGLPLTLLRMTQTHRYALLEMGMSHHGELRCLTGLARPHVALINNAMRAHYGHFGATMEVARAKAEILEGLDRNGLAILNADDAHLALFRQAAAGHRQVTFGLGPSADVSADAVTLGALASHFTLRSSHGEQRIELPVPGEHNVRNALAAASLALAIDVPLKDIAAGLADHRSNEGRLQLKYSPRGICIIDDSYNANPDSMQAGIEVLLRLQAPRWFVMGDIGELGEATEALHAAVGKYARARGVDLLLTLGEASRHAAIAYGVRGNHFHSIGELHTFLDRKLSQGTSILVKGSRFMGMERVVEHLMQPFRY